MPTTDELRTRLAEYVLGDVALEDFEDWFVSSTWNVHQSESAELQRLVFAIEGLLSEYSGDHISEATLRKSLSALAMRYTVALTIGTSMPVVAVDTGSTQQVTSRVELGLVATVGIQPAVAFA